jgi:phosphoribosylformylglycinamidine synthase
MSTPKAIILSGYGLNCEEETAQAFNMAGGAADIVHINDLLDRPNLLKKYQILAIPGGFSYGDDLGSGKAYANKLNNHLKKQLLDFAEKDKLIIGICNGFQILTHTGLLPGALTVNTNARYTDRWVDVKVNQTSDVVQASGLPNKASRWLALHPKQTSPWLTGIDHLSLPIAHGEGKYYADTETIKKLKKGHGIAARYFKGEMCAYQNLAPNPNGSLLDIAAITGYNGRVLGIMPHPERAMFFTQTPNWPLLKEKLLRAGKSLPKFGSGLQIFKNAIRYFT